MSEVLSFVVEAFQFALTPTNLLLIVAIALIGVVLGALPGVGPALAMALFFPFTFALDAERALLIMAVLYGSTTYGGSIPAVLLNIPGTPGSTATLLDGYPMTERGRGAEALGLSATSSFVGAITGLLILALFAPVMAQVAFLLGPPEYFMLAVFGLSVVSAVSRGSLMKSVAALALGVLFASVGSDPIQVTPRFTFGMSYLDAGVDLVVLLVGLFAVSQAIEMMVEGSAATTGHDGAVISQEEVLVGVKRLTSSKWNLARSSVLGTVIGAIPGIGITSANFLAYLLALTTSDRPETFGEGNPEGVIAGEASNNGSAMGALIPAMALGIPGGAAAAIFIGVMLTYGITPGPTVFQGELPYIVFVSIFLGSIVFALGGIFAGQYFARVTRLPIDVAVTGILTFALVGSFAARNNVLDVGAALFFGLLGFAMSRRNYSLISFILGFILAPIAERGFRRSLIISNGDYSVFVESLISIALLAGSVILFILPFIVRRYRAADV
jgi:putative tricarboxylic transport membrane protein